MPDVLHPPMTEISQWREFAHFPSLADQDWDREVALFRENYDPDKVTIAFVNKWGPWLIPINMLGWTEGLIAIAEEPDELREFLTTLTDYFVELTGYIHRYINPDIYCTGDDLAVASGPMISPDAWADLYKPCYRRIIQAIHDVGGIAEFHCCGNHQWMTDEFIEIGADILQLPMPNDALVAAKAKYGSRLVMTGGWDRLSSANKPGATEAEVRESAHIAIDTYGRDGALIFWDGTITNSSKDPQGPQRMEWLYDEVDVYGKQLYGAKA
jgi:uroporphyrinogen-III decarboxylase